MIIEGLLQLVSTLLSLLFAPLGLLMADLFANLIPLLSTVESLLGVVVRAASYFLHGNTLSAVLNLIPIVFSIRLTIGFTKFVINITRGAGA